MTVEELITHLEKIDDKKLEVKILSNDCVGWPEKVDIEDITYDLMSNKIIINNG